MDAPEQRDLADVGTLSFTNGVTTLRILALSLCSTNGANVAEMVLMLNTLICVSAPKCRYTRTIVGIVFALSFCTSPPVEAHSIALDQTLARFVEQFAYDGNNIRDLLQVGQPTGGLSSPSAIEAPTSPESSRYIVSTKLSQALAEGKTEVAGISKRPFKLAMKFMSIASPGERSTAEATYIQDRLFPALGSILARSIRVCTACSP